MRRDEFLERVYDKSYYDTLSFGYKFNPTEILQSVHQSQKMLKMMEMKILNLKLYDAKYIINTITKKYEAVLKKYDLSLKAYLILGILYHEEKAIRNIRVEWKMGRSQSSIFAKELKDKEYIKPKKGYTHSVHIITDKGREAYKEIYYQLLQIDKEIV